MSSELTSDKVSAYIQDLEDNISKMENGEKFLKDMKDITVERLDLLEYYDGLTVSVKKQNCDKYDEYLVSGEDSLYYTALYWELMTVDLINLKHFVISSRYAPEMDISKMQFPCSLETIEVPNFQNIPKELINKLPHITVYYYDQDECFKIIKNLEDYNDQKLKL
jgi:hypothetical protein